MKIVRLNGGFFGLAMSANQEWAVFRHRLIPASLILDVGASERDFRAIVSYLSPVARGEPNVIEVWLFENLEEARLHADFGDSG